MFSITITQNYKNLIPKASLQVVGLDINQQNQDLSAYTKQIHHAYNIHPPQPITRLKCGIIYNDQYYITTLYPNSQQPRLQIEISQLRPTTPPNFRTFLQTSFPFTNPDTDYNFYNTDELAFIEEIILQANFEINPQIKHFDPASLNKIRLPHTLIVQTPSNTDFIFKDAVHHLSRAGVDYLEPTSHNKYRLNHSVNLNLDDLNNSFFTKFDQIIFLGMSDLLQHYDQLNLNKPAHIIENKIVDAPGQRIDPYRQPYWIHSFYHEHATITKFYRHIFRNPSTQIFYNYYQTNFSCYKPIQCQEKLFDFCCLGASRRDFKILTDFISEHNYRGLFILPPDLRKLQVKERSALLTLKHRYHDRILCLPGLPPDLISYMLAQCKMACIPLLDDHSFSGYTAYAQALGSAIPTLTSHGYDYAHYGDMMFYYNPDDYESFKNNMITLIEGDPAITKFIDSAYLKALDRMDINRLLAQILVAP